MPITKADLEKVIASLKAQKKWLIIGAVVLAIALLVILFYPRKRIDSSKYDELNKAYNELLKKSEAERKTYEDEVVGYRQSLERESEKKDYYKNLANKNYQFYKDNEKKFRNASSAVKPIGSKDSLRAAIKFE